MTLLVGFPFGHDDHTGLELGATLARSSGQDLVIVTVVPAPWGTPAAEGTDREFEAWSTKVGREAVAEAESLTAEHCAGVEARAIAVQGRSVAAALIEQAESAAASLIVIGSGHVGAYGHVNLGSTADRLLHSSEVPVAIATRGYRASDHGRVVRVTCAFRGDEESHGTLARTAAICQDVGAALRIVTFGVRGKTVYTAGLATSSEDEILDQWTTQATAAQKEAVDSLADLGTLPAGTEYGVALGRSWGEALDKLPWERDEVLVIGSSQASLMERLFLGSAGTKIVRHAPVPVVVVP